MSRPGRHVAPLAGGRPFLPLALLCGVLASMLLVAQSAAAQTLYVDDRLQIGLHEAPSVASIIKQLVASGTALEVLERNEQMTRVRTADGAQGWVDARFLVEQPPGRTRAQDLERELAGAQGALADAQARIVALEQRAPDSGASDAASGTDAAQNIPSDALREMQALAQENQRLKQQLAELEAVQRMALEREQASRSPSAAAQAASSPSLMHAAMPLGARWGYWHLVLVASVLLLAFAAGGWVVDWSVRRRHGGFRI